MSTKTDRPKTKSKDEERFYQFTKALIAVPKKELDRQIARDQHQKPKKKSNT